MSNLLVKYIKNNIMKASLSINFKHFFRNTIQAIFIYILLLLVFAIFRGIILISFNNSSEIYSNTAYLIKAFLTGIRFDTMVIFYGLTPVMILNIIGIFTFSIGEKYFSVLKKVFHIYYTVFILLYITISIIDLYFYNFFMTHISILIFGFIEDDTSAVVKAIWTDYPVILLFIGLIIAGWCIYKLVGLIQKTNIEKINFSLTGNIILLLITSALFAIGMRGTFGKYALRINEAAISPYVFINNLVPNSVYSLKNAIKDKEQSDIDTNIAKTMKKWGFSTPDEAVSIYTGQTVPNNIDSLKTALMGITPYNEFLAQNPPNIVFIQMESMSEHFISFHDKTKFNLLGALDEVLPECIHFTHFLPSTDATINTLEGIMLNSPITPISQSKYMNETLETSVAKPFKEKGYYTSFVTGNKISWRNLDQFIPRQYFDDVEGSAHIEQKVPHTLSNEWGCYDEFLFNRIYGILQANKGKPQFVYGMTTTNHTPYSLPNTYKPYPVEIPETLKAKLSSGEEHAKTHFTTYQYANNCLGDFISKIKNSEWGENTIIVASGDHSARRIFNYPDEEMLQKYAVPLILYIPEKYKAGLEMPDTNQFASHKDIFPTLYNLSLSEAKYIKSGINLFNKEALSTNFAISCYKLLMDNDGCVFYESKPVFYVWKDVQKTVLKPAGPSETQLLQKALNYAKSYTASMTFLIQEELIEGAKKK